MALSARGQSLEEIHFLAPATQRKRFDSITISRIHIGHLISASALGLAIRKDSWTPPPRWERKNAAIAAVFLALPLPSEFIVQIDYKQHPASTVGDIPSPRSQRCPTGCRPDLPVQRQTCALNSSSSWPWRCSSPPSWRLRLNAMGSPSQSVLALSTDAFANPAPPLACATMDAVKLSFVAIAVSSQATRPAGCSSATRSGVVAPTALVTAVLVGEPTLAVVPKWAQRWWVGAGRWRPCNAMDGWEGVGN